MPVIKAQTGENLKFDKDKYNIAKNYRWFVYRDRKGHITVCTFISQRKHYLPKLVFNVGPGQFLLHKNGDAFNFTGANIKISDRSSMGHETGIKKCKNSKYIGVHKKKKRWAVKISKDKVNYYKGSYTDEDEAGAVADYIIISKFGPGAKRNFPNKGIDEIKSLYTAIQNRYGRELEI